MISFVIIVILLRLVFVRFDLKKMDEEERGGAAEEAKQTPVSSSTSSASEQEPEELLDPITLTLLVPPHFAFVFFLLPIFLVY
jgi:hypothetical protein